MKIFWDTNLFIYLWEKKFHAGEMSALAAFMEKGNHTLAASTLTMGEILVHPARSGKADLMAQYGAALQGLLLIPFDAPAALAFAQLRAQNPALRPPDAIQLACATTAGCDLFLTNDNRLAGVSHSTRLAIQSLDGWAAGVS